MTKKEKKVIQGKGCKGVVLVVDMIEDFYRGKLVNPRVAGIIQPIQELIRRKIKEGYEVIFLGDKHNPGDREFALFGEHADTADGRKVIKELHEFMEDHIFINKSTYSGFVGTELEDTLASMNPEEVIIVGVCTDICVFINAHELWNRGYKIVIARDTVETYDVPGHNADLMNEIFIGQIKTLFGAKVVRSQEEL